MSTTTYGLTEAQDHLISALDDGAEHVAWEFEAPDPHGIGTCGFAHIARIDGRSSFVQRMKAVADSKHSIVSEDRRNEYRASVGMLDLSLRPDHRSGYRLSIVNVSSIVDGPAHQRIDVRQELHELLLQRLQSEWGYLEGAYVKTRMD